MASRTAGSMGAQGNPKRFWDIPGYTQSQGNGRITPFSPLRHRISPMSRRSSAVLLVLLFLAAALPATAQKPQTSRPGRESRDVTLLPNGWRISPAGRHIKVGDLPLAMAESPDGRWLVISNDGYSKPTLS